MSWRRFRRLIEVGRSSALWRQSRTKSAPTAQARRFPVSAGVERFASKLAPTKSRTQASLWLWLWLSKDFQRNDHTRRLPRSGGLVEAEFQGLSGMDAARAAMGQGWPFVGGRLVRAPETSLQRGNFSPKRKTGCPGQDLCLLWVVCQSRSPEGAKHRVHAHTKATRNTRAKAANRQHQNRRNRRPCRRIAGMARSYRGDPSFGGWLRAFSRPAGSATTPESESTPRACSTGT
ncbi:hypothetical protein J2T47_005803 [Pseudomonas nitroreducens]|nr:hypothetical protein [Pseudomonas nitroreducens]